MSIVRESLARLARLKSWAARTFLQPPSVTLFSIPASQTCTETDETASR